MLHVSTLISLLAMTFSCHLCGINTLFFGSSCFGLIEIELAVSKIVGNILSPICTFINEGYYPFQNPYKLFLDFLYYN